MARPKGRTGKPTNLYLTDEVKALASRIAFQDQISLSELVEQQLAALIKRRQKAEKIAA